MDHAYFFGSAGKAVDYHTRDQGVKPDWEKGKSPLTEASKAICTLNFYIIPSFTKSLPPQQQQVGFSVNQYGGGEICRVRSNTDAKVLNENLKIVLQDMAKIFAKGKKKDKTHDINCVDYCFGFESMQLLGIILLLNYVGYARAVFTTTHANNIHTAVLTGYKKLVRPSATVTVRAELSVLTINDVDIRAQMMSSSGWLSFYWTDSRLAWTPSTYGDIEYIYLDSTSIWKPELVIDNTVSEIEVLGSSDLLFRVKYTGEVKWDPPGVYETQCEIDITWYPFDKQKCSIELTSWGYISDHVTLEHNVTYVNLEDYEPNGEWNLLNTGLSTSILYEEGETFSQLLFSLEIQRRNGYYILNVIFPILLIAVLTTVTFLLPADSGEKISYILTILLALAVLLTIIADAMPTTSLNTSVLGVYLSVTLGYAMIAIVITVLTLRLQVKPEGTKVPRWLEKVCKGCLVKIICYKKDDVVELQTGENRENEEAKKETNIKKIMKEKLKRKTTTSAWTPDEDTAKETDEENSVECDDFPYNNKDVAEIIDRFFFYLYAVLNVLTTAVFIIVLGVGSAKAA
ncbi:acetylcholine receptor non-alpha chain-like [Ylistrum balloti]|uniref:acetylcholine receptor non-alpha chain-like n=1 Tax=Ylistrum balloti TaxID=509963 RepID=UPI002905EBFF|nr:acetylcholine receptor non-alpha chain-like [Ylistrum balloti]